MTTRRGAAVDIVSLRKEYGGGPIPVVALDDIDLRIAAGSRRAGCSPG
jgi:hypothetical protein